MLYSVSSYSPMHSGVIGDIIGAAAVVCVCAIYGASAYHLEVTGLASTIQPGACSLDVLWLVQLPVLVTTR